MFEAIKIHQYEKNWFPYLWFERDVKGDLFIPWEKVAELLDPKLSLEQVHIELCKIIARMNAEVKQIALF